MWEECLYNSAFTSFAGWFRPHVPILNAEFNIGTLPRVDSLKLFIGEKNKSHDSFFKFLCTAP